MDIENESPPSRTTILSSFLRGRPRNASQSHVNNDNHGHNRELSPSPPHPSSPPSAATAAATAHHHRRSRIAASSVTQPTPSIASAAAVVATSPGLGISHMLRRRRSAGNLINSNNPSLLPMPQPIQSSVTTAANTPAAAAQHHHPPHSGSASSPGAVHRIRLVPHIEGRRSLRFDAIPRDMREGDPPVRIGRFTDRSGVGLAAVNAPGSNKLAFRSKVVSRAHAELWVEPGPRFLIKDTKSSSGTFLNNSRLSLANMESRPFQMHDGDILQLGVDYQGGTEDIYKSVKIRVEIGREWQAGPNVFNTNAIKQIRSLIPPAKSTPNPSAATGKNSGKTSLSDCCICLSAVNIRQALFIAPCSHAFHYKCIRPYLESHHPSFSCPLCRTYADLEEDVEADPANPGEDKPLNALLEDMEDSGARADREGMASGSAEGVDGDGDDEVPSAPASASASSGDFQNTTTHSGTGTVRLRRPLVHDGDRGAETEVEMDFAPPVHHPGGSASSSPGANQLASNSPFLPLSGATLTRRAGTRGTVSSPALESPAAYLAARVHGGGRRIEDEDEVMEIQIQREMMGLRAGEYDQDQVMVDYIPESGREGVTSPGLTIADDGMRTMPHAVVVPVGDDVEFRAGMPMEGVMELDGPGSVGSKRKR